MTFDNKELNTMLQWDKATDKEKLERLYTMCGSMLSQAKFLNERVRSLQATIDNIFQDEGGEDD